MCVILFFNCLLFPLDVSAVVNEVLSDEVRPGWEQKETVAKMQLQVAKGEHVHVLLQVFAKKKLKKRFI